MRHADGSGLAPRLDGDDGHRVQTVQGQRRQLLRPQRLVLETGREEAKRAEAHPARGRAGLPGDRDAAGVPHRDRLDASRAIDEHPDTPVQGTADRRHLAREIVGQDRAGWNAPAVETLEAVPLGRRESEQMTVQCRNRETPPWTGRFGLIPSSI